MTRGFVTIATGSVHYYQLAYNLVRSYRLKTNTPYPFAIISETENEYTKEFDKVIITDKATRSFMDKFLLLELCPFDENIFFDADCLAYGDLNSYWKLFASATDFSSLGVNVALDDNRAWYSVDGIGEYGNRIEYKVRVHLGVAFIRNTPQLKKLHADCIELWKNYDHLSFNLYSSSKDECIMGIAMPMNNMRAEREYPDMIGFYPCLKYIKADIIRGELSFKTIWGSEANKNCILLHFGTLQTKDALYRFESECLGYLERKQAFNASFLDKALYVFRLRKAILLFICPIEKLVRRVTKKMIAFGAKGER